MEPRKMAVSDYPRELTMVTAARDILSRTLGGEVKSASSAEMTAAMDDLSLHVEGIGRVRFPLTPAKVRKLIEFGEPARFGRGAQTLTDPDVRDTWEIPKDLVSAVWNDASLTDILTKVKDELGLPHRAELTADLHSFLVYEPDQFFLAHQDSEKDDSMGATLVVTLPSTYAGGELIVGRDEDLKAYRGSRSALSLVAFYADCRHEVRPVKSGYRIALTYNLLLRGDTSRPEGDAGTIAELTGLLREHFSTPAPRYLRGQATDVPNRLVYLLDHEYTPRALSWGRLKGADADRVSLLRAAANDAGCETILALADIRTQHGASAYDPYEYPRRWRQDDYGDDADAPDGEPQNLEIHGLIDSEVALTHWTGPDGTRLEETSLSVAAGEVCASTPTDVLKPSDSQYEGYMGNYGNTLDRWYHRAAVVVWPRALAFANRAEPSPVWALEQLTAMASDGDMPGAQAAAATLTPFWDTTVRSRLSAGKGGISELFETALRAGRAVADEASAMMLLRPFRVENLTVTAVSSFAEITSRYGQGWTMELIGTWSDGDRPAWPYGGWERPHWIAEWLPKVGAGLHAAGGAGPVAAQHLLDLAWRWAEKAIRSALGAASPGQRDQQLAALGEPLAALLSAAAAIGAVGTVDMISHYVRKQGDSVVALEMSALRVAAALSAGKAARRGNAGFVVLAVDCATRLRSRLDRPFRAHDDWSIELPADGCTCELCGVLRKFLADPSRRSLEWPLAEDRRKHVHSRVDSAELPVTHETRRQGRPYTLVLTKTDALFTADLQRRSSAAADLNWLAAKWSRIE
jgi:predicted 2-oxoglutarate/Fe(II)-dependent dioxygenase YbiX